MPEQVDTNDGLAPEHITRCEEHVAGPQRFDCAECTSLLGVAFMLTVADSYPDEVDAVLVDPRRRLGRQPLGPEFGDDPGG